MKILVTCLVAFIAMPAMATEYLIELKQICSTGGARLAFECKANHEEKYVLFFEDNAWWAKIPETGMVVSNFRTLRDDANILILESKTVFSGHRTVHIYKENNRFNVIEVAYSDIIKDNETTIKQGIYVAIN